MGAKERRKGATAERELAAFIRDEFGIEASRSARNGVDAAEDITHSLAGIHIECKRVERLNVPAALAKAGEDARGKLPTLWHRRNRGHWMLTLYARDLQTLVDLLDSHRKDQRREK